MFDSICEAYFWCPRHAIAGMELKRCRTILTHSPISYGFLGAMIWREYTFKWRDCHSLQFRCLWLHDCYYWRLIYTFLYILKYLRNQLLKSINLTKFYFGQIQATFTQSQVFVFNHLRKLLSTNIQSNYSTKHKRPLKCLIGAFSAFSQFTVSDDSVQQRRLLLQADW